MSIVRLAGTSPHSNEGRPRLPEALRLCPTAFYEISPSFPDLGAFRGPPEKDFHHANAINTQRRRNERLLNASCTVTREGAAEGCIICAIIVLWKVTSEGSRSTSTASDGFTLTYLRCDGAFLYAPLLPSLFSLRHSVFFFREGEHRQRKTKRNERGNERKEKERD